MAGTCLCYGGLLLTRLGVLVTIVLESLTCCSSSFSSSVSFISFVVVRESKSEGVRACLVLLIVKAAVGPGWTMNFGIAEVESVLPLSLVPGCTESYETKIADGAT